MGSFGSQCEGRPKRAALVFLPALLASSMQVLLPAARAGETETFGFSPHPVVVQGVSRRSFDLAVARGAAVRDAARVFNKTNRRLAMRIYGADASRALDGTLNVAPFGVRSRGVGGWIRPDVAQVTLSPKAENVVGFAVARPPSGGAGLGALVAEEIPGSPSQEPIQVVTRVALLVKVVEGSGGPTFLLEGVAIEVPIRFVPSRGTVSAIVTNGTAEALDAKLVARVRTLTGRTYDLAPSDVKLAPGEKRSVRIDWSTVPRWGGLMKAHLEAQWTGGTAVGESGRMLVVPLWLLLLFIMVLAFIGVWRGREDLRRRAAAIASGGARVGPRPGNEIHATEVVQGSARTERIALSLTKVDAACRRALEAASAQAASGFLSQATRHLRLAEELSAPGAVDERDLTRVAVRSYTAAVEAVRAARSGKREEFKKASSRLGTAGRRLREMERSIFPTKSGSL